MGKSRSVTVMIAYILRQHPGHTVSSALELIRESRPVAEPNDGFMAQLELYKEMGCPKDIDAHPKYQRWLYQREVDLALAAGMAPDRVRFEDEEIQEEKDGEGKEVELRCRKCRCVLFRCSLTSVSPRLSLWHVVLKQTLTRYFLQANISYKSLSSNPPSHTAQGHANVPDRPHIFTSLQSSPSTSAQCLYASLPSPPLLDAAGARARSSSRPARVSKPQMWCTNRPLRMAGHEM